MMRGWSREEEEGEEERMSPDKSDVMAGRRREVLYHFSLERENNNITSRVMDRGNDSLTKLKRTVCRGNGAS